MCGHAARMCLELGLHRREQIQKHAVSEFDKTQANSLFWVVFILDHRLSHGTSMPCSIREVDIDPYLEEPVRKHTVGGVVSELERTNK